MKKIIKQKLPAVTLNEVLITMLIIGILAALAYPVYEGLITKAKSKEAELQLLHLHRLEKTHFLEKSKYTNDLGAIGFQQETLVTESENGTANYRIEIVDASTTTFTARATAVVDFDGDGEYNVWEIDQDKNLREVVPD